MFLNCFVCHEEIPGYIEGLKTHIKKKHSHHLVNLDSFQCSLCIINFSNFSNLIRHIKLRHPNLNELSPSDTTCADTFPQIFSEIEDELFTDTFTEIFSEFDAELFPENADTFPERSFSDSNRSINDILQQVAEDFVLVMRSMPNTTDHQIQSAISVCNDILFVTAEGLRQHFLKYLDRKLSSDDLLSKFEIKSPFLHLNSRAKQNKFIESQVTFVQPKEIKLGIREENVLSDNVYIKKFVKESFQYAPIIETLQVILNDPVMHEEILNRKVNDDPDKIKSFFDGDLYKEHPLFNEFPDTIALQLYLDDVEVCNPLGPNRKIHKICPFYFSILNLPPYMNSKLKSIHTVLLPTVIDIENYGYEKILEPLLTDLKKLESHEGVTIKIGQKSTVIHATIVNLSADTLAAHSIFGLLSPACRHFCRLCLISRSELHENINNMVYERRTIDNYTEQLRNVENEISKTITTETGIQKHCVLNNLKFFHLTKNFGLDTMHDLLEGVVPYEIKCILRYMVLSKPNLTVELLNSRIQSFQYGYKDRKNKPKANLTLVDIKNTKSHKLKSSSSQTLCLLRVLPFILGDFILDDIDRQHLELLTDLIEIVKICGSSEINRGIVPYLHELVKEHLQDFSQLFPNQNLINKHHHLVHYAECFVKFGPLQQSNCMRYEAKHMNFKKHAQVCKNYKNISKTLMYREQVDQINCLKDKKTKIKSKQKVISSNTIQFFKHELLKAHFIEVYGIEYVKKSIVCLKYEENDPVFAQITDIVIYKEIIWFSLQLYDTVNYSPNYAAYHVKLSSELVTIKLNELTYKSTFSLWSASNGYKYVNVKSLYFC